MISRLIAFAVGMWCCYCFMIHSYDGAITILFVYVLTIWIDPFYLRHKKSTTVANSRTQNK